MSSKLPDFESLDYDNADVVKEDARVDAWEARHDADRVQQQAAALHTAAVQEAVSQCLDSCLACLDVLYLQRDAQPFSEVAIVHNSWQQEAEPAPCTRDAWLRGALPETVVPARAASAASTSQTAARSSAGKEQRLRPGSGLLSSRKGPGSVASSAAADASAARGTSAQQRRRQMRPQQSRRTSVANSVQSMKVSDGPAAAVTASRPSTSTVQRPGSGAGNASRPSTAQHSTPCNPAGNTADAPATPGVSSDTPSTQPAASAPPAPAAAAAEAAKSPAAAQQPSTSRKQAGPPSHLTPDQQEAEDRLRQELQLRRQQEQVIKVC